MSALPRLLIVDDEAMARERLKGLIEELALPCTITEASNGMEAWNLLQKQDMDVVLLDIQMPGMDGMELARHLLHLHHRPALIFITAFDQHAIEAFEVHALDYLLKPIRLERLRQALEKAGKPKPSVEEPLRKLQKQARSHLSISSRGRVFLLPVHEVLYLKAELKYVTVKTAQHEYLLEETLTHLEEEFGQLFLRIHRNCLVARSAVIGFERVEIEREAHWVVLLQGCAEKLPISRRQQHLVREFGHSSN